MSNQVVMVIGKVIRVKIKLYHKQAKGQYNEKGLLRTVKGIFYVEKAVLGRFFVL